MTSKPQVVKVYVDDARSRTDAAGLARIAEVLAAGDVAHIRVLPAPTTKEDAVARLRQVLEEVRRRLCQVDDLPHRSYVEVDEESYGTPVAPFQTGRFLLPHQDGGHSSYLTPSGTDVAEVAPDDRTFSQGVYWKRPSHKLYQGFVITHQGDPPGVTYYYSVLSLLCDAFARRHPDRDLTIEGLGGFLLHNIRTSKLEQPSHRSRYLTLGGLLGADDPALHVMPSGPRAESDVWPEQYGRMPHLAVLVDGCPCGLCTGPGERLLCHAAMETLGVTWPGLRQRYESSVVAAEHELLIGNNLTQLHAARSSSERRIRPMCIVVDEPVGPAYESWLARQWKTWFSRMPERSEGPLAPLKS